MATKLKVQPKQLTAWSFSRYQDYKKCPLLCKLKHLDKVREPGNKAMERGAAIHTMAEQYVKGLLKKLPPELVLFKEEFAMLRKQYKKAINGMVVEDNWAFTKDWDDTAWDDWTGCWLRIKLDLAFHDDDSTLLVWDWKTGKFREEMNEEYVEQLDLYALAALLLHPHIETVKPRLAYLDQGMFYPEEPDELVYTRADVPRLKKLWEKRVRAMMNDRAFSPRPNDKCMWCFYGQAGIAKGGPGLCKY